MAESAEQLAHACTCSCAATAVSLCSKGHRRGFDPLRLRLPVTRCRRAVKTIIAESCDAAGQAKAMGYMTSAMGVGAITGPSIAGLLTRPCRHSLSKFALCDEGSLLLDRCAFANCRARVPVFMIHACMQGALMLSQLRCCR